MPTLCINMSWVTVIRSSHVKSAGERSLAVVKQVMIVNYFSKTFQYSKLLARHVEAFHRRVDGLRCSFEQCTVKSKRLVEIRNHVRQAHSVKNPVMGSHFSDDCADQAGQEDSEDQEKDLAAIYDCLDQQIDVDVLNESARWKPEAGDVIKEEDLGEEEEEEEDAEKPPSVMESSGKVSKPSSRPSGKRKRAQTDTGEKLVVKIQSKRQKRKAIKKAETAATVVSETDIKDEPADDHD